MPILITLLLLIPLIAGCGVTEPDERYWRMHVIDDSLSGADGVDLFDIDGDGDKDAIVVWEESGELMLYENPGADRVHDAWGRTSLSGGLEVGKIEDARVADFDADGLADAVVSATEKRSRRVGVHWLNEGSRPHHEEAWRGTWLETSPPHLYLKVAIGQIDGIGADDIVAGSKADGEPGALVWFQAPANVGPESANEWRAHVIDEIDWIDSVVVVDINEDGHQDILMNYTDNLVWYENVPATNSEGQQAPSWIKHLISDSTKAYFAACQVNADDAAGSLLVVGADIADTEAGDVVLYLVAKQLDAVGNWNGQWLQREVRSRQAVPRDEGETDYQIKSIVCANLDDDERPDIVISTSGYGHGVFALMNLDDVLESQTLDLQVISAAWNNSHKGIKHDNVLLVDLDGDGDLDIITTEENGSSGFWHSFLPGVSSRGLGLIWFENPGSASED
ncbi:MAG: VCBS repeat-containing protein [Pseudomonadota bacterium]